MAKWFQFQHKAGRLRSKEGSYNKVILVSLLSCFSLFAMGSQDHTQQLQAISSSADATQRDKRLALNDLPGLPQLLTADSYHAFDFQKAMIGRLLFHDKILSGNKNIACNTCHHELFGSGDGLSLGIGEGGVGIGPERTPGTGEDRIAKRIPRNAQGLWNLGHRDIHVLFHDGRLSVSELYGNGFNSPAEEWLPSGLTHILSAQALFPLVAQFEMAGNTGENEVAGAIHDRIDAAWPIISRRVRSIPEYADMFVDAFEGIESAGEIDIVAIGESLGAFMGLQWQSFDSPFDAWQAGNSSAMTPAQLDGLALFYGKAGCVECHSGPLFTDQAFHALSLPAFGPGRTRRFDPMPRDTGRLAESDSLEDAYRFRTPSLRNVALTAPYGHNGAYPTLSGIIRHHVNPKLARARWRQEMANLPTVPWLDRADFIIHQDHREMRRQNDKIDISRVDLTGHEIGQLVAFMQALTGESATARPFATPIQVPSGLSID